MSYVTCPCGFRADGVFREANDAYRAHECEYHDADVAVEPARRSDWPGALVLVVCLVAVVVVCALCTRAMIR